MLLLLHTATALAAPECRVEGLPNTHSFSYTSRHTTRESGVHESSVFSREQRRRSEAQEALHHLCQQRRVHP